MERRLSKVNGRFVEPIFMFHKNGRRLQDGGGMEPFTAMEMASEWTMDETSPESMGPTTCEPGSELCSEDGFTFCSFPGWPCPAPMSRRAAVYARAELLTKKRASGRMQRLTELVPIPTDPICGVKAP